MIAFPGTRVLTAGIHLCFPSAAIGAYLLAGNVAPGRGEARVPARSRYPLASSRPWLLAASIDGG